MALDGLVISHIVNELNNNIIDGRINKINQPEKDELILTIKSNRQQYKLLLSANPSLPLVYFTNDSFTNPMVAPNFCMLLRKHLNSAKIISITQPDFERVINIKIEHYDELGDLCYKHLIIELMGKHSNIIFTDDNNIIIDSIKHISALVSSVREVLPGREYFIPKQENKCCPINITLEKFIKLATSSNKPLYKFLYTTFTGISPLLANEICNRASIESEIFANSLSEDLLQHVYNIFSRIIELTSTHEYKPCIVYQNDEPIEYCSIPLTCYTNSTLREYDTICEVLNTYYSEKAIINRIKQKSIDMRHIITTSLERARKKYSLQEKQLDDTNKKEKYKIYGELLTTYGYNIANGSKNAIVNNYYTGEDITIPLDPTITPIDNAKKYFDKYNKLKRTFVALSEQIVETKNEIDYLESISNSLDIALYETDLIDIKNELINSGYIRNRQKTPNKKSKGPKNDNKPLHFLSSDGFHIYVGKNNFQNDELTFKFASNNDWWFHAKGIAGSHVIVKSNGEELPDKTFEEAGQLAAYYSKGREQQKVEIDYIQKKHIKKPNNAKPGFVIYHTNYSLIATPNITSIQKIN